MSEALIRGATIAGAWALGSIPFGVLVARASTGADVRQVGSGNIGATNVMRASGPAAGALTLALDMGKGAAAVLLARAAAGAIGGAPALDDCAALAAVVGHMFPPWLRFRGGKGVATAAGALAVLSPLLAAAGLIVFAATLALSRIVSLASMIACVAIAAAALVVETSRGGGDGAGLPGSASAPSIAVVLGICALVLVRHASNLARLVRGREPALGEGRGARRG